MTPETADPIRILIVDDEQLIREGLRLMLGSFPGLEIVGTASDGGEAHALCGSLQPDLVLMDIRMPGVNGVEGTKRIRSSYPGTRVLILTTFQDSEYITETMAYGASGYLLKDSTPQAIAEGIRVAVQGKIVLDPEVSRQLLSGGSTPVDRSQAFGELHALSDKELELIREVAAGRSNREIAERLHLSEGTIKNNISALLATLELQNRTQLVILAYEEGLIRPGD